MSNLILDEKKKRKKEVEQISLTPGVKKGTQLLTLEPKRVKLKVKLRGETTGSHEINQINKEPKNSLEDKFSSTQRKKKNNDQRESLGDSEMELLAQKIKEDVAPLRKSSRKGKKNNKYVNSQDEWLNSTLDIPSSLINDDQNLNVDESTDEEIDLVEGTRMTSRQRAMLLDEETEEGTKLLSLPMGGKKKKVLTEEDQLKKIRNGPKTKKSKKTTTST